MPLTDTIRASIARQTHPTNPAEVSAFAGMNRDDLIEHAFWWRKRAHTHKDFLSRQRARSWALACITEANAGAK